MRASEVAASAFRVPALICGSTTTLDSDVAVTWLPSTAVTLSWPLLKGMAGEVAAVPSFNILIKKCGGPPVPAGGKLAPSLSPFFVVLAEFLWVFFRRVGIATHTLGRGGVHGP